MCKEIAELVVRAIGQGQSMGEEITGERELDDGGKEEEKKMMMTGVQVFY